MYHEVSDLNEKANKQIIAPLYNISVQQFEYQMALLHESGYKTVLMNDLLNTKTKENNDTCVILTFDDGLIGNYRYAVPILRKYDIKGIFFVVPTFIGKEKYMNWQQLNELSDMGMSVQSHTLTHRPLQTLSSEEIFKELDESKKMLEDKLKKNVLMFSLPHGSFDNRVIEIAKRCGYNAIFTSQIRCTYYDDLQDKFLVLGRIPITDKISIQLFRNAIEYDCITIKRLQMTKSVKNFIRNIIGVENYRKIYRYYFKINL